MCNRIARTFLCGILGFVGLRKFFELLDMTQTKWNIWRGFGFEGRGDFYGEGCYGL
jgi:uncharacterized membrane protein YedE/YeeE